MSKKIVFGDKIRIKVWGSLQTKYRFFSIKGVYNLFRAAFMSPSTELSGAL